MQSDNSSLGSYTHPYMIELESENFQKLNKVIPHILQAKWCGIRLPLSSHRVL